MNLRIDWTKLGGFRGTQKTFKFMQDSYREAFAAIAKLCGDKVILTGVEVAGGLVSDGWIVYNGELIKFTAGAIGAQVVIAEAVEQIKFKDDILKDAYYTKTATCGAVGSFAFSDLVRLNSLQEMWQATDVKQVDCNADYIAANFDGTGLGINKRKGWAICNGNNGTKDRRGLFSVQYDERTVDPANGIWDIIYATIGAIGGEKEHQLTEAEMPSHDHDIPQGNSYTGPGGGGRTGRGDAGPNNFSSGSAGGDQAHENRPPFIVTLFIQKL